MSREAVRKYRARNKEALNLKAREHMREKRAQDPEAARNYMRQYRAKNVEKIRAYQRKRARNQREWIRELKEKTPCSDCGGFFHFSAMDFDHVRGEKIASVGVMTSLARGRIEAEIRKCEIVCANCHRIRTWKRQREKGLCRKSRKK